MKKKYQKIRETEVRFESIDCDDADYIFVAFGSSARICQKAARIAREKGLKVGLFRPISLFPFPHSEIKKISRQVKGILSVELNAGQMIEDIRLASPGNVKIALHNHMGGVVPAPEEVYHALIQTFSIK